MSYKEGHFYRKNISNFDETYDAINEIHPTVIVHLAANPNPGADFETILDNNIRGTYNVVHSAYLVKTRLIVLASSIRVVEGFCNEEPYKWICAGDAQKIPYPFPDEKKIGTEVFWPTPDLYSASKVWVEALGKSYAYKKGSDLRCIILRFGWISTDDRPYNQSSEKNCLASRCGLPSGTRTIL